MRVGTDTLRTIEHMKVVCSKGDQLGVVDHVEGGLIKLTKQDSPDQKHHYIPTSLVSRVDRVVHVSKTGDEIMILFEDLHKKGNTIILVTHEEYIAEHAHRIIRVRDGLVASDETVRERKTILETAS